MISAKVDPEAFPSETFKAVDTKQSAWLVRVPAIENPLYRFFSAVQENPGKTIPHTRRPQFPTPAPHPLTMRVRAKSASPARPPRTRKNVKVLWKTITRPDREPISQARAKIQTWGRENAIRTPRSHESARCTPRKHAAPARGHAKHKS